MKCIGCNQEKLEEEFSLRNGEKYREGKRRTRCKKCEKYAQRDRYEKHRINSFFKHKATRARARAKYLGVEFDLDELYLASIWTNNCPILGIELNREASKTDMNAAEIDRLIPELGYVKGNVTWMSRRANQLKNNGSLRELRKIVEWMESTIEDRRIGQGVREV